MRILPIILILLLACDSSREKPINTNQSDSYESQDSLSSRAMFDTTIIDSTNQTKEVIEFIRVPWLDDYYLNQWRAYDFSDNLLIGSHFYHINAKSEIYSASSSASIEIQLIGTQANDRMKIVVGDSVDIYKSERDSTLNTYAGTRDTINHGVDFTATVPLNTNRTGKQKLHFVILDYTEVFDSIYGPGIKSKNIYGSYQYIVK